MKSVLRSTLILSSSAVASIGVGLISAKAGALLLGPAGLGVMGLLQSVVSIGTLAAGVGISTGVVRYGANYLAHDDHGQAAALFRAAWQWVLIFGGLAALALVALRAPLSRLMFGSEAYSVSLALMALALLFSLAGSVQSAILNAYHRVAALARLQVLTSVLGTAGSLAIIWIWRGAGIAPALVAISLLSWIVAAVLAGREQIQPAVRPRAGETAAAARQLLRFALPYTASMLVGTGVQMALPVLIVNTIGQTPEESASYVGFYRAATVISVSYLGFLLSVLGQDYYPRVSAVSDQPAVLAKLVNEQHRLVLLLAGPMILLVLALTPILVPLIYSREFLPSVDILEWYLIGDLLRFTSWTIGFVVLARSSSIKLFLIELLLGINTLVASWLGMRFLGLPGLGVGFLFTYIVHYLVVWRIVKRDIGLVLTKENLWLLGMCLAGAALIRALPMVGMEAVRTPVALVLAGVGGLAAAQLLWREMGGVQMLRAWLGRAV